MAGTDELLLWERSFQGVTLGAGPGMNNAVGNQRNTSGVSRRYLGRVLLINASRTSLVLPVAGEDSSLPAILSDRSLDLPNLLCKNLLLLGFATLLKGCMASTDAD